MELILPQSCTFKSNPIKLSLGFLVCAYDIFNLWTPSAHAYTLYHEHRIELFLTQLQIHIGNPKPTLQLNGFNLNLNDNATQYTLHTKQR